MSNDPAYAEAALDVIELAATRGATLTNQLLSFARKQRLDGRLVNMNTLVDGLRPLIERTLGRTITIENKLHRNLPNAKVDTTQAELAVLNG